MSTVAVTTVPSLASRAGGWLLALSLPAYVLVPITGVVAFSRAGVGAFADITKDQMASLGGGWTVAVLTVYLALLVGNAGLILVALQLRRSAAAPWPLLAAATAVVAVIAGAVDAALRIVAEGFSEATLGENALFLAAEIASNVAFSASALAIALLALAYFAGGAHRATGIVVGSLGAVLFLISLLAYAFVPPFALALLWVPLGIVWLVGLRRGAGAGI